MHHARLILEGTPNHIHPQAPQFRQLLRREMLLKSEARGLFRYEFG
jgi:hypothetical protein